MYGRAAEETASDDPCANVDEECKVCLQSLEDDLDGLYLMVDDSIQSGEAKNRVLEAIRKLGVRLNRSIGR